MKKILKINLFIIGNIFLNNLNVAMESYNNRHDNCLFNARILGEKDFSDKENNNDNNKNMKSWKNSLIEDVLNENSDDEYDDSKYMDDIYKKLNTLEKKIKNFKELINMKDDDEFITKPDSLKDMSEIIQIVNFNDNNTNSDGTEDNILKDSDSIDEQRTKNFFILEDNDSSNDMEILQMLDNTSNKAEADPQKDNLDFSFYDPSMEQTPLLHQAALNTTFALDAENNFSVSTNSRLSNTYQYFSSQIMVNVINHPQNNQNNQRQHQKISGNNTKKTEINYHYSPYQRQHQKINGNNTKKTDINYHYSQYQRQNQNINGNNIRHTYRFHPYLPSQNNQTQNQNFKEKQ